MQFVKGQLVIPLPRKEEWRKAGPHYIDDMLDSVGKVFRVINHPREGGLVHLNDGTHCSWAPEWLAPACNCD